MDRDTIRAVLDFLSISSVETLDITGGAPELNPYFRELVIRARAMKKHVIDRCNLTILEVPGQEDLAEFLASNKVEVIASLPCYLEQNVDKQRGNGVFASSIRGLKKLNAVGFGKSSTELVLNLVYNPTGPYLPPPQSQLEADYKRELGERYGIKFNHLYTLTNLPIARFGNSLVSKGKFTNYMELLYNAHRDENIHEVMCRTLISVDYQGYIYDCDFNQMLGIGLTFDNKPRLHLRDLRSNNLQGNPISVADHCYGCTAGQGSSCVGALS